LTLAGRSVGQSWPVSDATVDRGNLLFDLAAAVSAAADTLDLGVT